LAAICREWNAAELYTVKGLRWDGSLLKQFLRAESLAGFHRFQDPEAFDPEAWVETTLPGEPVLDRDVWDRIQMKLDSRKNGRPATAYVLSGQIKCGRCGSPMYGRPQKHRDDYAVTGDPALDADRTRRQYWCAPREKEQTGCGALCIDQRFADSVVREIVVARLSDPAHVDTVNRVAARITEERKAILVEIEEAEREIDNVFKKMGPGKGQWKTERAQPLIDQWQAVADAAHDRLEAVGAAPESADPAADAAADWDGADIVRRRSMVEKAIPEGITIMPATSRGKGALKVERIVVGTPGQPTA
jgi:hypothetical protein